MYYILYGLYVFLGLVGCACVCYTEHMETNKNYFKYRDKPRSSNIYEPFKLSRRGLLIILLLSIVAGPLVFIIGFFIFMCTWINEDWTGFWSKPVCNCFEPKEGK